MESTSLPQKRQIDESKLVDYLLHPVNGQGKAGFFTPYGFTQSEWWTLKASLLAHANENPVTEVVASKYGTKYIVTGVLRTPSGRVPLPVLTTVWQQDLGTSHVRLITAYPA